MKSVARRSRVWLLAVEMGVAVEAAGGSFGAEGDEEVGEDGEATGEMGERGGTTLAFVRRVVELGLLKLRRAALLRCGLLEVVSPCSAVRAGYIGCGQKLPLLEVGEGEKGSDGYFGQRRARDGEEKGLSGWLLFL